MTPLLLALLSTATAGETTVTSDTVLQLRHDFFAEGLTPAWELLHIDSQAGHHQIEGYVGLEWANGLDDELDPDLYALTARSSKGHFAWIVGRQQVLTPLRPQTLDGASLGWRAGDHLKLNLWGGYARHQDLDDLADGVGMARLDATWRSGSARARVGSWIELEQTPVIREDVELNWSAPSDHVRPQLNLLVGAAQPSSVIEIARVEGGYSPTSRLRHTVIVQHRQAADPQALLGEAILDSFAPDGVDTVGTRLRLADARWAALAGGYELNTFMTGDTRMYGHTAHLAWVPGRTGSVVRLLPAYRFQSGPGGMYHAAIATMQVEVTDNTGVDLRGALVPYRKLHDDWDLTMDAGLGLRQRFGHRVALRGDLQLAHDALFATDLRGGLALHVEVP